MDRLPVISRSVTSVGYDPDTKTLELEFVSGTVYQYFDVPQSIHDALMAADSKGAFVNTRIKGYFRYTQI